MVFEHHVQQPPDILGFLVVCEAAQPPRDLRLFFSCPLRWPMNEHSEVWRYMMYLNESFLKSARREAGTITPAHDYEHQKSTYVRV